MIIVATQNVQKSYGADPVLTQVTLEVKAGERVGIVGPNGAGKTTLFKLLIDAEAPDAGEIYKAKGSRWAYLPQHPHYDASWTGRDVIASAFLEVAEIERQMRSLEQEMSQAALAAEDGEKLTRLMSRYQQLQEEFERRDGYLLETKMANVINGLGIAEEMLTTLFEQLSGGEKTKVGLAKLLCEQSDVLLLDEPTNHLDVEAMEWLEGFLREYPGTILVISHDRYFLDAVVTAVCEVDGGEVTSYQGNYTAYVNEREERLLRQFAEYQEQQKKIKKMQETIKRLKEWGNRSNPPNEAFHRRAKSMEKALARIERIERPKLEAERMGLSFQKSERSGTDVLIVERLSKSFAEKHLFCDADLLLRYGERKALLGPNGCGKSTLVKILLGEQAPDSGHVRLGSNVKIGYLSQQAIEGDPKRRVIDAFREYAHVPEGEARHKLARFLFYGEQVFKKVGTLSGGERMRLRLAQLMQQEINLLILDEPTNHLDIEARETLEEAVAEFRGSLFIISHDRYFLQKIVDGVFWVEQQAIVHYEGTYEEARSKRKEKLQSAGEQPHRRMAAGKSDRRDIQQRSRQDSQRDDNQANQAEQARESRQQQPGQKEQQPQENSAQQRASAETQHGKRTSRNTYKIEKLEQAIAELEQQKTVWQTLLQDEAADYQTLIERQRQLDACEQELSKLYDDWYELQA